MVKLIDIPTLARLINQVGIETFITRLGATLEADYKNWQSFNHQPRNAVHSPQGVYELMITNNQQFYSYKYVNGHPANPKHGKLTVVAFGMLAEMQFGYPLLICEMNILTALRTACISALAAKYLMPQGTTTAALIGTGAQAEFQTLALTTICGVTNIRYFDLSATAMNKFAAHMQRYPQLTLTRAKDIADCVAGAHIITTATAAKSKNVVVADDLISGGVHLNAIGGDTPGKTEYNPITTARAKVFVEYEPQTRHEGEIQHLPNKQVTELWQLFTGAAMGRTAASDLTMFDSVGYALNDFSALRLVYDLALEHNIGADINLIPTLPDPRDLFGLLTQ